MVWGGGMGFECNTRANSFCGTSFFCVEVTSNEVKYLIPALPSKFSACVFNLAHG